MEKTFSLYCLNTQFPLTSPLFPLLLMLNTCFAQTSLVSMYHFLARRAFALRTFTHLNQTTSSSSSSSPFLGILFFRQNTALSPHLFAPLSVACHIIIICMKSKFNCIRTMHKDICTSSPRSLFISVFSIFTPPPNAALLFPLYEIVSSDHGLFLLSFPLSDSLLSVSYHFHLCSLTLWLLKTIPNFQSSA